jgi:hypothetical protein
MNTKATLPDFIQNLIEKNEPHPLFDKSESRELKYHKYVESNLSESSKSLNEVGTLTITENSSNDVLETNFDKVLYNRRILLNYFFGTYSSPKNYSLDIVINDLYNKGYKNVTYDMSKIKTFEPNWFQKYILQQKSFKYFDYSVEYGFLFEVDDKDLIEIDTSNWSHI